MNYTQEKTIIDSRIKILNFLPNIGIHNVNKEILTGLTAKQKYISSKFFYNKKGSELFEKITYLEEYYPTKTEKSILLKIVGNLDINFENLNIVELGSGDSSKISLLLQQVPIEILKTINYFPVDISQSAIEKSVIELEEKFTVNDITGIVADFVHQLNLLPKPGKRLFCFLGSTIGNFTMAEIKEFMTALSTTMQQGDSLLLGIDMIKDIVVLEKAYNDKSGITATFNKNILNVVNNLVNTDFKQEDFEHLAFYNRLQNRIEMHLKAIKDVIITSALTGEKINIKKGETIHTENSHKFSKDDIITMADWAGLTIEKVVTDDNNWFSLIHFKME